VVKLKNLLKLKEKLKNKYLIILFPSILFSEQDSINFNLNDLWNTTSWDTVSEINEVVGEVEQVTTVAGVRGSEAKNEILKYLWYRKRAKRNG